MYKPIKFYDTVIKGNPVKEGEPIEVKVRRLIKNKEPIKDGAPIIFTERKDGVLAAYNIRTDRWEIATDAMDKVHASKLASRDNLNKTETESDNLNKTETETDKEKVKVIDINKNKDGKAEPTQGKADEKSQSK